MAVAGLLSVLFGLVSLVFVLAPRLLDCIVALDCGSNLDEKLWNSVKRLSTVRVGAMSMRTFAL
jgi:hypothetical protein